MLESQPVPVWVRYLPQSIRSRVLERSGFLKVASNLGWVFGERAVRLTVGVLVSVWVARYLGPEQFGLLNYALSLVALVGPLAAMGLPAVAVRELVESREDTDEILGSAFVLQLAGGLAAFLLALLALAVLRPEDALARSAVVIIGLTLVLRASWVVKYWFESRIESKYTVWVESAAFLASSALKAALILGGATFIMFAWATFLEGLVVAVALLIAYILYGKGLPFSWRWRSDRVWMLFLQSWPLILSSLAAIVYMRVDQIMLGQMIGDEAVGIYSAAVRISEVWYFIPTAIAATVYPKIIEARKTSPALYEDRLQKLYDLMVLIAVAVAVPLTLFSDLLTRFLYGLEYAAAGSVLAIHIWGALFVFLGTASGKWFVLENRQMLALRRTSWGMVINIGLNFVFIPRFGVVGAAYATILSFGLAAFALDATHPSTYSMFIMKLRSLNLLRGFKNVARGVLG